MSESFDYPLVVQLPDPLMPPTRPEPGCDTCGYWELKRRLAEGAGDLSGVVDCRIEIQRHPAHGKGA